jgi:hypothetical protein
MSVHDDMMIHNSYQVEYSSLGLCMFHEKRDPSLGVSVIWIVGFIGAVVFCVTGLSRAWA